MSNQNYTSSHFVVLARSLEGLEVRTNQIVSESFANSTFATLQATGLFILVELREFDQDGNSWVERRWERYPSNCFR